MGLSTTDYSPSIRLPFALRYRVVLASSIAAVSYIGWLAFWSVSSVTFALAAVFGDRASRRVLDSSAQQLGDVWQWVMTTSALVLVVVVLGKLRFATASATAWYISMASLAILGALTHGFNWVALPILLVALILSVYAAFGARAA